MKVLEQAVSAFDEAGRDGGSDKHPHGSGEDSSHWNTRLQQVQKM